MNEEEAEGVRRQPGTVKKLFVAHRLDNPAVRQELTSARRGPRSQKSGPGAGETDTLLYFLAGLDGAGNGNESALLDQRP